MDYVRKALEMRGVVTEKQQRSNERRQRILFNDSFGMKPVAMKIDQVHFHGIGG